MLDYEKRHIIARCATKDCEWNEDCFNCPIFFPYDDVTTTRFGIFRNRHQGGTPFKSGINYWRTKKGHGLALCINLFSLQLCIGYYWGTTFNKRLWCKRKKKGG